jgi:hypothetical protein
MPPPRILDAPTLLRAFRALDDRLAAPVTLVVGGGTAMMLGYGLPVRTTDVDAYPTGSRLDDIAPQIREVAHEVGIAPDWLNPHFETFAHVLPPDYGSRLKEVFAGARLRVTALGVEDLLVMKCFAGREKDVGHARALLRRNPDLRVVERRIEELEARGVRGAAEAADFLDDLDQSTRHRSVRAMQVGDVDAVGHIAEKTRGLVRRARGQVVRPLLVLRVHPGERRCQPGLGHDGRHDE